MVSIGGNLVLGLRGYKGEGDQGQSPPAPNLGLIPRGNSFYQKTGGRSPGGSSCSRIEMGPPDSLPKV